MSFARALRSPAILCALLLLTAALIAHPVAEIGGNDDFAYVRSAKILAETGRIAYVGWSSAMLGWQLALGAAFIKLFGFSFTVTRISILCVGMVTAGLLQRTAVRLGLNEWNATLATLTLVLSPLYLSLSVSFMSDVPGLLAIVAALYCCARAFHSSIPRTTAAWLVAACALSTVIGTARQTGWLGTLIVVPCTCWVLRRRQLPWAAIAGAWLVSVLSIYGCMKWFSHQMYSTAENAPSYKAAAHQVFDIAVDTLRLPLETAFVLAPLFFAFSLDLFRGRRRAFYALLAVTALFCAFFALRPHGYWATTVLVPAANGVGNYVTPHGILELPMPGERPLVLGPTLRIVASAVSYFSGFAVLAVVLSRRRSRPDAAGDSPRPSWRELLFVIGVFALAYCALMAVRIVAGNLFDRYLLPLFMAIAFLAVRYYQETVQTRLPAVCYLILLPIAVFGVAGVHDMFAADRARLAAIDELRSAGLPRDQIYGGFAYDGWTQIDKQGYIDVDDIRTPAGINHISDQQADFDPCGYWPAAFFPAIHSRYLVSYDDRTCEPQSMFAPVPYHLWLAPHNSTLYIRAVDPERPAAQYRRH
jgi:hypothetical protein